MTVIGLWWAWLVLAVILAALEVLLPVFVFLGFAAGAMVTGIALALTGAARYLAGRQQIEAMDFQPAYRSILATTVAAVIVGLIAIAFVWLVRPMP